MDRRKSPQPFDCQAVPDSRCAQKLILLSTCDRIRAQSSFDAPHRRNLYRASRLWVEKLNCYAQKRGMGSQSQTNSRAYENNGDTGASSRPCYLKKPSTAYQVPLSPFWGVYYQTCAGVEHRYYLHQAERRFCLLDSSDRLVQPAGLGLAFIE